MLCLLTKRDLQCHPVVFTWEREGVFGNPDVASTLVSMAEVHLHRGGGMRAVALLERALPIQEQRNAKEVVLIARTRFILARALVAAGHDLARATRLAEQARDTFAQRPDKKEALAAVTAWLRAQRKN